MGLLDRVFLIKLHSKIDAKLVAKVNDSLANIRFYKPQLIAVSLNSTGGSLVQAKTLASNLRQLSDKTGAPLYTFAEDFAFESALVLLTAGHKAFGHKFSVYGEFGYTHRSFGLKEFSKEWGFERKYIYSGENKVRLNQYEDLKEVDKEWIQNILLDREQGLRKLILQNRQNAFEQRVNTLEQLFNKAILTSQVAHHHGLIDEITSLDELLQLRYNGVKVLDVMKQGYFEQMHTKVYGSFFGGAKLEDSKFNVEGFTS